MRVEDRDGIANLMRGSMGWIFGDESPGIYGVTDALLHHRDLVGSVQVPTPTVITVC